ncbi:MAG: O-antigen ligase family protein [Acidobacteria bacterium]|nr:O-antigen ligase family protein [Acidobacteriota bacterium]
MKERETRSVETEMQTGGKAEVGVFILLLAIALGSTIGFGAVDQPAQALVFIIISITAALWAYGSWRSGRFFYSRSLLQLPLAGLVLIGFIQLLPLGGGIVPPELLSVAPSSALSIDPYATRLFTIRLLFYLVFFAMALVFIRSTKRLRTAAVVLLIFGPVMAMFGITQRLANPDTIYGIREAYQAVPFGSFINQHHFAALMVMISGIAFGLLAGGGIKRDKKPLLWIGVVIMLLAIVFTGSRGAMISYIGMALFVFLSASALRKRSERDDASAARGKRLSMFAGAAAFIVIVLGLAAFMGVGDGYLRGIGDDTQSADLTNGRTHFWAIAGKIFLDSPVIGTGHNTYGIAFTQYDTWKGYYRLQNVHNEYLQALSDSGIIGFACVAAFIFLLFRNSLKVIFGRGSPLRASIAAGSLAGILGILIHSFFDFPLRTPSNGFVFLILAAMAVAQSDQAHGEKNETVSEP